MAKDPAILFYTGDFLNGCMDLTFEERGQYITLLCLQHQKGHLSEKTIRLSLGSVSVDVMSKFQQDSEGLYFNQRMDVEIEKRTQFVETRRNNGKLGGRPSKPTGKPTGKPNEEPLGVPNENENRNDNDIKNRRRKPFKKPTIEEVRNFFKENGYDPNVGEQKWHYYNDADWYDSHGNPVLNWKQKMRSVWFRDEFKIKPAFMMP